MKTINTLMLTVSAAFVTGLSNAAHATGAAPGGAAGGTSGPSMSDISQNIIGSMADVPGVLSAFAYLLGIGFAIGGVIKIKDHVDNPQTPLKDGAIRLAVGGALFSLPFLMDVMNDMISSGDAGGSTAGPKLNRIEASDLLQ